MAGTRSNRVQGKHLHQSPRRSSNEYYGNKQDVMAWAKPYGAAGGHLDGDYPNPTIRLGVITAPMLSPEGATEGDALVFSEDLGAFELRHVVSGSGAANHLSYWFDEDTLADMSHFVTEGGTLGIGPGVTGEPEGHFIHLGLSNAVDMSGIAIASTGIASGAASLACIEIDTMAIPGVVIRSTGTGSGTLSTGQRIEHASGAGTALAIAMEAGPGGGSTAGAIGITAAAGVSGAAIAIAHLGTGDGLDVTAGGGHVINAIATSLSADTVVLRATNDAVTTADLIVGEVLGTGRGLHLQRSTAAAEALVELSNTGSIRSALAITNTPSSSTSTAAVAITTGNAPGLSIASSAIARPGISVEMTGTGDGARFELTNVASGANAVTAVTLGSGAALAASSLGTGYALQAQVLNAASTSAALRASTIANAPIASLYRNVAEAMADGLSIALDHATDEGIALRIGNAGKGKGLSVVMTGNTGVDGHGIAVSMSDGSGDSINVAHSSDGGAGIRSDGGTRSALIASSVGDEDTIHATAGGEGYALRAVGGMRTDTIRITSGSPAEGMSLVASDTDGNAQWGYAAATDRTCLVSIYTGDNSLGNIAFPGLDNKVQVPLDLTTTTPYVCNDQWDTSSVLGAFTPTKNLDPSGATTDGVVTIEVHLYGLIPVGWTNSDVALWIRKGAVYFQIARVNVSTATGGTRFHLHGVWTDKFSGTDSYRIYASQGGAAPGTFTTWNARVATTFQHTPACADCSA